MAFTLASTTDTQEQIDHAASESWREPMPEPPGSVETNADGASAEDAGAEDAPARLEPTEPNGDGRADGAGKRPGGFQKRITKLTAKLGERDAEIDRLQRQLAERESARTPEPAAPRADAEPNPDQFENANEYIRALARWEARQANREITQNANAESEAARQQEVFRAYNDGVAAARAKYEDFDETVGSDRVQIPQAAAVAIIESDNGPEIAYWLGKNPDAAEALAEMSPAKAAVEVGRIAERLARPAAPAKPQRPTSAAPPPATPVRGSAPQNAPDPAKLSFQDYVRARRTGTIR